MSANTTILKLNHGHKFSVVYRAGDDKPYRIYRYTWAMSSAGYTTERKRLEAKYADFKSCLIYIANSY